MDPFAADQATLVPGRLRVFRCWRLDGTRLTSTGHDFIWRDKELTAVCLANTLHIGRHVAPVADCACGIYGWYNPLDCRIVLGPVLGCVEVWGRVVLGSNGVRAEHARIVALAALTPIDGIASAKEVIDAIARVVQYEVSTVGQQLNVPVFATVAELIAAFPVEDLSALGVEPIKIRPAPVVYGVAGSVAHAAHRSMRRWSRRQQRIQRIQAGMRVFTGAIILITGLAAIISLINRQWGWAALDAGLTALNIRTWGRGLRK